MKKIENYLDRHSHGILPPLKRGRPTVKRSSWQTFLPLNKGAALSGCPKKSVFHIQKTGATYSNSLRMRRFQPIPPPSSSWNSCSQHPLHTSSLVSPRPKRPKSPLPVAKRLPSSVSTTVCCASAMLRAQLTGNFISKSSWAHPSSSKHNHGILFFVGETWGPGGPKSLAVV